jgi:hypothetical protein
MQMVLTHVPLQQSLSSLQPTPGGLQQTPFWQSPWPHWPFDVHVRPGTTDVHRPLSGKQKLLQQSELAVHSATKAPQVVGWHWSLMQPSPAVQQVSPATHAAPEPMHSVVEVDVEDVELVDVDVVPLTQAAAVPRDAAVGHPDPHACPAAQQVRFAPLPHGVVPAGQPHWPWLASMHATPRSQHIGPQGVAPFGQQHDDAGSVHVPPLGQQP